jgi:hypothetical protein
LNLQETNKAIQIMAEIEVRFQHLKSIMVPPTGDTRDELDKAVDGPMSYDTAREHLGQEGIFTKLMAEGNLDDRGRNFVTSVWEGFKKYNNLTDKQHSALAKVWWHAMVKDR